MADLDRPDTDAARRPEPAAPARLVTDDGVLVGSADPFLDDLGHFRLSDALRK